MQKGKGPSQYQSLASYVAKYVVSPPISVRRIDRYDGHRVTYHYRSHWTQRTTYETVDVMTFIGRMVQHTMSKGFKRIRYYGVQATKTFAKVKVAIQPTFRTPLVLFMNISRHKTTCKVCQGVEVGSHVPR